MGKFLKRQLSKHADGKSSKKLIPALKPNLDISITERSLHPDNLEHAKLDQRVIQTEGGLFRYEKINQKVEEAKVD